MRLAFVRPLFRRRALPPLVRSIGTSVTLATSAQTHPVETAHPESTFAHMADNYVHFYASSPINRLGWLRNSATFLNLAITHPRALFIPFHHGRPLLTGQPEKPAYLPLESVSKLIGPAPWFGQGEKGGELREENKWTDACRFQENGAPLVFLGVLKEEGTVLLPSQESKHFHSHAELKGAPYWAVDTSDVDENWIHEIGALQEPRWSEPRPAALTYSPFDASLFSTARTMIDWNGRNQFCPACGSPQFSLWGGWKLGCSTSLPWSTNKTPFKSQPCPSGKGLHNYAHPRTDGVVIIAVLRESPTVPGEEEILLGRNKPWPKGFYSVLSGFWEPGESVEDAVRRELLEEAGLQASNVRYHSSQPWPYPANLMLGCYARADLPASVAGSKDVRAGVRLDLDNELEDARWFTRAEIRSILADANPDGDAAEHTVKTEDGTKIFVTPRSAVGGVLIAEWAGGEHVEHVTTKSSTVFQ